MTPSRPLTAAFGALLLALSPLAHAQQTRLAAEPPAVRPCPAGLPADARCLVGRDYLGAGYWMALPARWNGELIVHVGDRQLEGPAELPQPPLPEPAAADLSRWAVWVKAGYAWAGATARPDAWDTATAVDDTERLRQAAITEFGRPKWTWLHGHGWGAIAATRMAARYTTPDLDLHRLRAGSTDAASAGKPPYDGVLLTNGLLAGARNDDLVLDARVVYQAVCQNHPRPDEPAYPLWMGLPLEARMSRAELARRVDACTGVSHVPTERTAAQKAALATLTQVLNVPESALLDLLARGTWQFQSLVWRRLAGKSGWGNEGVRYTGSGDDEAFNARVARYPADAAALGRMAEDLAPAAQLNLPVLTLHAARDGVAVVEMQHQWRRTMEESATAGNLLQVFTDDETHGYGRDAQYLAAAAALRDWAGTRQRPTPQDVAARCSALDARWQPAHACRMLAGYNPAPLDGRVPPRRRERPADAPPAAATAAGLAPANAPRPAAMDTPAPATTPAGPTPRLPPPEAPPPPAPMGPSVSPDAPSLPPTPTFLPRFDRPAGS